MKKILCVVLMLVLAVGLCLARAEKAGEEEPLIWIPDQDLRIEAGQTVALKAHFAHSVPKVGVRVQWSSDAMTVATVNSLGRVSGVSLGDATITCEALLQNGEVLRTSTTVHVIQPMETLTLNGGEPMRIGFDTEAVIPYTYTPEEVSIPEVTWTSWNPEIATVAEDGTVRGISAGNARVTAQAADGRGASATLQVTVTPVYAEDEEISFDRDEEKQTAFHFSGESFEELYLLTAEKGSVSFETEEENQILRVKMRPKAITEDDRLLVLDRKDGAVLAETKIRVEEGTICDAQKLKVDSAELVPDAGVLTYRIQLTNRSAEEIGEIGFLVDYRDQFGDTHYLMSNADGTLTNFQYTTMFNILPGQTKPLAGKCEAFRSDDLIREVRVAVCYYRYVESGRKVYIPASPLYWFSSKSGDLDHPEKGVNYEQPDVETVDKAERISYDLRATMCDLYPYAAKPFCRSYRSGKYIAAVGEGGWAKAWKLRAQDVIYGADDLLWEEDPFFLSRAFARVYDGETVTLKVVRNGEEIELPIARNVTEPAK